MLQKILKGYFNFSTNLDRIFRILVRLIIGLTLLYCFLGTLLFPPDFKQFNSNITKIEFETLINVDDSTKKMKSIIVSNPEIIKLFCEDLKNYSKPDFFETSHPKDLYFVKCYRNNKVLEMRMGTRFNSKFIISFDGNFGTAGTTRKYSNEKLSEFIDSKIKPLIQNSGVIP